MDESEVLLEVEGLTKHFGGVMAVRGVNLSLRQGEIVGLIGPNGAGKTTFFNCATGFLKPDSGSLKFRGEDITRLPLYRKVDKGIARTFQLVRPFAKLSVLENVGAAVHGRERGWKEPALEKLELVGLAPRQAQLAQDLSHGELKLLELARALATEPQLLLLDEPFGGLSYEEIDMVDSLINKLHQAGLTIFIVEHKLRELMRLVERVVVFHLGEVIVQGSPEEVVENERVISVYLGGR